MQSDIPRMNRVAIVLDDHQMFTDSFTKILDDLKFFDSVLGFTNEIELKHYLLENYFPEQVYLFLDYRLKNCVVAKDIQDFRSLLKSPKVITISGISSPLIIKNLASLRPDGILHKIDQISEIRDCIQVVNKSKKYYSGFIKRTLLNYNLDPEKILFTGREIELLNRLSKGLTEEEIAKELNISPHSLSGHKEKMIKKLKFTHTNELIDYARKLAII